jgi:glucokinase
MIGAVDIGGTKIAVGLVDDNGRVVARAESSTDEQRGYPDALGRICDMLRQCAQRASENISGVGIGSTGPVDPVSGTFGDINFLPHWKDANIVEGISQALGVTVALENDADAAALGEASWGAGKNKQRLVYVTVGTGIGAAIVLDGKLYRGVDGAHPEIGHHCIDPAGPLCLCGFRGCWEAMAAGPAMVEWLRAQAPSDYPHFLGLTAKRICELAIEGDELARQGVEREAHFLGLGLANLVTLFAPDSIVLGGSVMKSAHLFMAQVHEVIRQSCRYVPFAKTEISLASLGEDTNLIGAARVWHHRFAQGVKRAS